MSLKNYLAFVLIILFFYACQDQHGSPRISLSLSTNWTFNYLPGNDLDKSIITADFDDSTWPVIGIPHTWQTYETTGELHPFIKNASERDDSYWWKGWGYYRKKFMLSEELTGKQIEIEFDGVQKYSRIYLNGQYLGDHKGGFTSFYFDLTPEIKFGEENVLVIAVNNRRDDKYRIPPMNAGNWNVYGGIYRDVRMVVKNPVHIPYQGSYKHEGGTFIKTPAVNKKEATVDISTFVRNTGKQVAKVKLNTILLNPEGKQVKIIETTEDVKSGEIYEFKQSTNILSPILWHPDSPKLYQVLSNVYVDENLVDELESPLGFRWFHWDYEEDNLWLNGEIMPIRGMNRHQEYPWVGDAIPKWLNKKDFMDMKQNMGINFTRAAHYPNDPLVYDLTDKLGMVVVEEVPNIKSIDFDEDVQKQNVMEMIRRDRNHPSILFWSVGNETSDAADSKWVIEEDQTRIIHSRKGKNAGDYVQHDHNNLDMENLLRVTVKGYFDEDNAPIGRPLTPEDGQFCSLEEWQHTRAMMDGGSVRGSMKKNVVFWLYEDHGADREYKNSPLKHLNYKGWVDSYRFPKYIYYLTQAMYTEKPMAFIHSHNWTPKYLGQSKDFIVNSNCDKLELFHNNTKIGETNDLTEYNTYTFKNIEVKEGELKVVGSKGDQKIEDKVVMSGKAAKIKLSTSHQELTAGKSDMAIITVDVLDKENNRVIHANNTISWQVEGPAHLIGPEIYESDFEKFEELEGSGYIRVPVSNIIRSGNLAGEAKITVSSKGLEPASLTINVVDQKSTDKFVIQPKLEDVNRMKIARDQSFKPVVNRVAELKHISGNKKFDLSDNPKLENDLMDFILADNPEFDVSLQESKVFINWLVTYIKSADGNLIGDDFNFKADRYNDCRFISKAIDQSNLLFNLATELVADFAQRIIINGETIDVDQVVQQFLRLPKNRMVLLLHTDKNKSKVWISPKETRGTRQCNATDFESLAKLAYPGFGNLTTKQKKDFLQYVDAINPQLKLENGRFNLKEGDLFCLPDPVQLLSN